MSTPERCFKCSHWNYARHACDRVLKIKILIAHGGGDLDIQTQPGLIPDFLEDELTAYLVDAITTAIDSYPGWTEIFKLQKQEGCAGHKESIAIKQYGRKLKLADPLKNLDEHGLFKSDISAW